MKKNNELKNILIIMIGLFSIMTICTFAFFETFDNANNEATKNIEEKETDEEKNINEENIIKDEVQQTNVEEIYNSLNSDIANILSKRNPTEIELCDFVNEFKGKTIEFDAYVNNIMTHDNYKTRYDILLMVGDYVNDDHVSPGPIFKIVNANSHDLGNNSLYLPSFMKYGTNVHVVARVENYNQSSGVVELKSILVKER